MARSQVVNMGNGASVMINRPPTLIANTDPPRVNYQQGMAGPTGAHGTTGAKVGAMVILADPTVEAAAKVAASTAITLASLANGDTIILTVRGVVLATFTAGATDTNTTAAAALAAIINNSVNAKIAGIIAATSAAAVLTIRALARGPVGNSYVYSSALTGSVGLTPASGNLGSGSGTVLCTQNFTFTFGNVGMAGGAGAPSVFYFLEGKEYIVGGALLNAMVTAGMPII